MDKILIANRGEIAVRIISTCRRLGIRSVAVYSDADRTAPHVAAADEAWYLGPAAPSSSYLNVDALLRVAAACAADGVHPGYGFLSENADFAQAVQDAGLNWIGPNPSAIRTLSSKAAARDLAKREGIPVLQAQVLPDASDTEAISAARALDFPLLIKASAGGGGIGMVVAEKPESLPELLRNAGVHAQRQFGDPTLLVEPLLRDARHIEVQLACDSHGSRVHLYERDCSSQRRRQKILEEAPAPNLSEQVRATLRQASLKLAAAVNYTGVGTVEFLVKDDACYLLEMNTRLQVEHTVTELVTGLDLVAWQIDIARGLPLPLAQSDIPLSGHAIEARLYAETPGANFTPATGTIIDWQPPTDIRVDSGIATGYTVSHHYDGLLCKLVAHGSDRETASAQLRRCLSATRLLGLDSNQFLLGELLRTEYWRDVSQHISFVEQHAEALSQPQEEYLQEVLMAATLWAFRDRPPAADLAPWPGAYQTARCSSWRLGEKAYDVDWQWRAADCFDFPQWQHRVILLGLDDGELLLELDGRQLFLRAQRQADALWLWHPVIGANKLLPQREGAATRLGTGESNCMSPGPGVVLKVLVEPGEMVSIDQPLLVLESMKMETTLRAHGATRVAALHVQAGNLVESGQLLVELAPPDSSTQQSPTTADVGHTPTQGDTP